ncbi:MAG TPA: hypothetical protein VMP42_02210 [Actinomycetota bacterium]|nr:hypothetical protein [Actinomycetota bacterium]
MAAKVRPEFRRFAMLADDPEAVIQRIGRDTWDCILIDVEGTWVREVFPSQEAAEDACRRLGVRFQIGWDQRLAQRMNRRDHWGEPGGQRRAV